MNQKNSLGTILHVDDEFELTDALCYLLDRAGYRCLSAQNGHSALSILEKEYENIDLIISDISMPVINGIEFYQQAVTKYGYLPFVMFTAHAEFEYASDALRLGAIDYMTKPFSVDDLLAKLPTWIEIGRRQKLSTQKLDVLFRVKSAKMKNGA